MFKNNPYFRPDACGLEILFTIEDTAAANDYLFRVFVLWRHMDTGRLYWVADSGCSSCHLPCDDYHQLSDLNELTHGNRTVFVMAAMDFAQEGYGNNKDKDELTYRAGLMLSRVSSYFKR